MNNTEVLLTILSVSIATGAFSVSLFTLNESIKRNRGSVMLGCLDKYLKISRLKDDAIKEKSRSKARLHYREKFDLLWSEFRMWNSGLIPKHVMYIWAHSLHKNLKTGCIEFNTDNGEHIHVALNDFWEELVEREYFHPCDAFTKFVELIRQNQIDAALKLKGQMLLDPQLNCAESQEPLIPDKP